jgi:hypothetical protein
MIDRRHSWVRWARRYQKCSKHLALLDYPFQRYLYAKTNDIIPAVFVVGTPRSGTTLAYQTLHTGLKSFYLTNLWNMLYATPAFGGMISSSLCRNHSSHFSSCKGLVGGVCGEAEGMRFWEHWTGQSLKEEPQALDPRNTQKIARIITSLGKHAIPFISGYLGHAFSMQHLRTFFPGALFVHVTRALTPNACSVFTSSPHEWFSVLPKALKDTNTPDRKQMICRQLLSIHRTILENSYNEDTFIMPYEDLCKNPGEMIQQFIHFVSQKKSFQLQPQFQKLPDKFHISTPPKNALYSEFNVYMSEAVKRQDHYINFFQNLL